MDHLDEYRIKNIVEKNLNRIKRTEVIKSFVQRNEFKSQRNKALDKECIDFLFGEIEKLSKALILCNACQTVELSQVHDYLEHYENKLKEFESEIVEKASKGIIKRLDERRQKNRDQLRGNSQG